MKYIVLIAIIGITILIYSLSLHPYTDESIFRSKYTEMSSGQSKEYFELREKMLTPKYRLQDTGITMFLFSTLVLIFLKFGGGEFKMPKSKLYFVFLAWFLPFFTVSGYVFDLMQGMFRGEFPRWADSLGIPLIGVPIQFITLVLWSILHLRFIKKTKLSPVSLKPAISIKLHPWLIFILVISLLLIILTASYGQYWYAVPGALWVYYYLSLGAIRNTEKST